MRFELAIDEADPQRAAAQQAYLKLPGWRFLGLKNPQVHQQVRAWLREHRGLDRWIEDEDFWIRRSALLVHLKPLSRGEGDWERFTRYAEATLPETEFFVRKAIGWVLRAAADRTPERVADWLLPRAHAASGVTLREAVKRLPEADRDAILERYKKRRSSMAP